MKKEFVMKNDTTRANVAELLKECPAAFRQLHIVFGFDFCNYYNVEKVNGKYTINKLIKAATENGYNSGVHMLLALTKTPIGCYDHFHAFTINENGPGKIEVDYRFPYFDINWKSRIDNFYCKSCVDDVRKNERAITFIIWQSRDMMHKPQTKPADFATDRFILANVRKCGDGFGNSWIDKVELYRTDASGEKVTYSAKHYNGQNGVQSIKELSQVIDKSGYLLIPRRNDLNRRAIALRKEREKAAYDAQDNSQKVKTLFNLLMSRKAEIIKELENATTYADVKKINEELANYKGLAGLMFDFELFEKRTAEKSYCSVADSNRAYLNILNQLNKGKDVA